MKLPTAAVAMLCGSLFLSAGAITIPAFDDAKEVNTTLTTRDSMWSIDFYQNQDCSGTPKSTEGTDITCLKAPTHFAILREGDAIAAETYDDPQTCLDLTGNLFRKGQCAYLITDYILLQKG